MLNRIIIALALLCLGSLEASYFDQPQAVIVKVAVADCLGTPAQSIDRGLHAPGSLDAFYEDLAFSPETGPYSCPRVHQALFNEVGIMREEKGEEVRIEFPHLCYVGADKEMHSDFWLQRDCVHAVNDMTQEMRKALPEPVLTKSPTATVALILPWEDEESKIVYSAGTRFVHNPPADTAEHFSIFLLNYEKNVVQEVAIPRAIALPEEPRSLDSSKKLLIEILRLWIAHGKGVIPYVWGGCSYCTRFPDKEFFLQEVKRGAEELSSWQRPGTRGVRTGFDCSGLVLRVAQLVGLTYVSKNTTTIGIMGTDVPDNEPLQQGDLMLVRGHVMVVSDIEKGQFIDAASYSSGYGCLRECSLGDAFAEVDTYEDMRRCVRSGLGLIRKARDGNGAGTLPWVRIIRLADQQKPR